MTSVLSSTFSKCNHLRKSWSRQEQAIRRIRETWRVFKRASTKTDGQDTVSQYHQALLKDDSRGRYKLNHQAYRNNDRGGVQDYPYSLNMDDPEEITNKTGTNTVCQDASRNNTSDGQTGISANNQSTSLSNRGQ